MPPSDPAPAGADAPKVVLVTGATGFVGRHLLQALRSTPWNVVGVARRGPTPADAERCRFVVADLREPARVERAIRESAPDYVLHLAAATPPSPDARILAVNVMASTMLLEAVARERPSARVLIVGCDAQYGPLGPANRPTRESAPMRPLATYGRSKIIQEAVALRYAAMAAMHVVCVRPFDIMGPGQSPRFVVGKIAHRIAQAEIGAGPTTIEVGRLDVARDFTDVRDVARAFLHAIVMGRNAEVYNIGTGVATSIEQVARTLASMATTPIAFRTVRHRFRAADIETTQCDASKLRAETGWAPAIPLEQSLADALQRARDIVSGRSPSLHDHEVSP